MASLDETALKNVAKTLRHAGRKLLKVHSVDKLLQQLDKLELSLSILHQEPTEIIQESLVPVMKALISDELLKHTEEDVKISVTSCITQITRITAPDVPYDDEQMKEIFKLVVASFEKLSDISGRGCEKALAILDNVNMVRLCLVMLDLECDDLVIEMFHHFLTFIRSHHSHNTIHSMESIMTLVLQESEQISPDLLRLLLDSVESKNQIFSPISCLLGEKVMRNCAVILKPHLMKAVELSGRALNDYAFIVRDICTNGSQSPEHHSANSSKKKKASESCDQDNSLVGRRIKVWWPLDKMFYEGVIDSYYANKGTHKILYTDGEVEVLNLKKERWELVAIDVSLDEEGNALQKLAEASDMAEKGNEISEFESAKGADTNSRSRRGRTSARNSKSESAVKSVDRSNFVDDSPITAGRRGSARKITNKRKKTGSDTKKNRRGISDDLE